MGYREYFKAQEGGKRSKIYDFDYALNQTCKREYMDVVEPKGKKYFPPGEKFHWCGIYATWVWSRCGFDDVCWRVGEGIYRGGKKLRAMRDFSKLAPGDIVYFEWHRDVHGNVDGHPQHYVIAIDISVDMVRGLPAQLNVIEGNSGGPKPFSPKTSLVQRTENITQYQRPDLFFSVQFP
jgi:hypothetical protein